MVYEILKNTYELYEEIGRGRFGTIHRGFCPASSSSVAVKIIHKSLLSDDDLDRSCLQKEPKIMYFLSPHPNILHLRHVDFDTETDVAFNTNLCSPQTLHDRIISRHVAFSEPEACVFMTQLLMVVAHCHKMWVAHRDLKSENVLFDDRDVLKVADFGSAEWFDSVEGMEGVVGTLYYVAPEVLIGRVYHEKIDMWSLGVVMYLMIGGSVPFYGEAATEIFQAVLRGNLRFPVNIFREVSSSTKDLMRKLMCRDVSRRLSAEQALRHPWILGGECLTQWTNVTVFSKKSDFHFTREAICEEEAVN